MKNYLKNIIDIFKAADDIDKSSPTSSQVHVPTAGKEDPMCLLGKQLAAKMLKKHDSKTIAALRDSLGAFLDEEAAEKARATDADANTDMYPGIDNLEGGMLKSALGGDDNQGNGNFDMQQIVEGIDWEMEHGTMEEGDAYQAAVANLTDDPMHYRMLERQASGSDDTLTKDTQQTEENPFAEEGYNLDLGSGPVREPGHIGIDTYPYDYGTIIHDLTMGIPFGDDSCSKIRMCNVEMSDDDMKPLLSEIHRVLMPGGQFTYEGPNEIYNYQEWRDKWPGFTLINHEDGDGADDVQKDGEDGVRTVRQQFTRLATPDPASADDAWPRIGVGQLDQLGSDALLAADAMSYYWSDATASGRGNQIHGYPSQGALDNDKGSAELNKAGGAGTGGWSNKLLWEGTMFKKVDKDQMADPGENDSAQTEAAAQVSEALKPKINPNPAPPERMKHARPGIAKVLKSIGTIPIMKFNDEKQIVYGVVLEPNTIDAQEDFMEPQDIEASAHEYLAKSRIVGSGHTDPIEAHPVESFIAPQDFEMQGQNGPQVVKKGSWVLGVKVVDPDEWEKVKSGEYTGFSVGGFGLREEK